MRRAAPPQMVRVDPTDPGPWARVASGPRGLGLAPAPAPQDGVADERVLRPARGVPFATHRAMIVNEGAIVLTAAPGVARTLRFPDLANLFDRRPPGLVDAVGAPSANAGLLADDAGWRAVVLPSMGDLVADLGSGPVAVRSDGRRVAAVHDGAIFEIELPGAATTPHSEQQARALAYDNRGELIVATDAGIGAQLTPSPVASLVAASAAPVALTLHEDGRVRVWDLAVGAVRAEWPAPDGLVHLALSPDGTRVACGLVVDDAPVAVVARTDDGAPVRSVAGARVIAFDPADRGILVGGDWGALWMEPPREAT